MIGHLGGLRHEVMLVAHYDRAGMVMDVTINADGEATSISTTYRALIERSLMLQAAGLVMVHNHPSGDPTPSRADVQATRSLHSVCRALQIEFFDHVVVGGRAAVSMKMAGLMK